MKPRKKLWDSNGIRTHDLRDTGAMLYQLKPRWKQVRCEFNLYPLYDDMMCNDKDHMSALRIKKYFTGFVSVHILLTIRSLSVTHVTIKIRPSSNVWWLVHRFICIHTDFSLSRAMSSPANKEQFLKQFESIVKGIVENKARVRENTPKWKM